VNDPAYQRKRIRPRTASPAATEKKEMETEGGPMPEESAMPPE